MLAELQFCKRLLDQGVPLEKDTVRRIVEHAIALEMRKVMAHDDFCRGWTGGECNCEESPTGEIEVPAR